MRPWKEALADLGLDEDAVAREQALIRTEDAERALVRVVELCEGHMRRDARGQPTDAECLWPSEVLAVISDREGCGRAT